MSYPSQMVPNGSLRQRQGTGHVLSPLDNSPPVLGGTIDGRLRGTIQSAPTPQRNQYSQVAIQFVKDFYLALASQPDSVWPYYHETDSVVSRPEENQASNEGSNVSGHVPIYRTLTSSGKSYRFKINTVDSQPSVDGGVHLLVTGQIQAGATSRPEPSRPFAQSFHLAHTKDGASYYIRNDVLRLFPAPQPARSPQLSQPLQSQPAPPSIPSQSSQPQSFSQPSPPQQPSSSLPVARPRSIPSASINPLSASLASSAPALSSAPLKTKAKEYDDYDPVITSSQSISQTLNNTSAIPEKIISHTPIQGATTAAVPSQQHSKPKMWGDREEKREEEDEDEETVDFNDGYNEIKKEQWIKKAIQPQPTQLQPQTQPQTQPQPQTPTPTPAPAPTPAPTQSQPPQQLPSQSQPQSVASTSQAQPVKSPSAVSQPAKPVTQSLQQQGKPAAHGSPSVPNRQPPAAPPQQAQTHQPEIQKAHIQHVQPAKQTQDSKHDTQTKQAQETKQGPETKQVQATQPTKRQEPKTYAGRIGTRNTPERGYYRQPKPLTPTGGDDYRPKEPRGRGRGRGRAQGQQEFRPINRDPTPSLYVSGLPETADEEAVANLFKSFGAVKNVDFPPDKNFCFVHFESQEGVDKAMGTDDDLYFDGLSIWYEPKRIPPPRSGGGGGGRGGGGGNGAGGGGGGGSGGGGGGSGGGGGNGGGRRPRGGQKSGDGKNVDGKKGQGQQNQGQQNQGQQNQGQKGQKGQKQAQPQKQGGKQFQGQNQQHPDDGEGSWQNVEYRSTTRRNKTAEKKGEKKVEKRFEKKSDKK